MNIQKMFDKPKVIGIVADVNTGKSNLIYHLIDKCRGRANVISYGLRKEIQGVTSVTSIRELENVENSILFIDEFMTLFDLDNRKVKRQIENTIRLINHNNNIVVLAGLPENYKKFIGAKLNEILFKRTTIADLINGCAVKRVLTDYCGDEKGSFVLALAVDEVLHYNGSYRKYKVPYMKNFDTKAKNVPIFVPQKGQKNCAGKNVLKMCKKCDKVGD